MNTYLSLAHHAWSQSAALRADRARYMKFTFGNQWGDIIETPDGRMMSEGRWAKTCGVSPITNNLIRRFVKTVVGRFRVSHPDSLSKTLHDALALNNITELDTRLFEDFLISGCAIQKVTVERRPAGNGIWVDNVPLDRFFVNRFTDTRGLDIELIGMIHDMSAPELISRFGSGIQNSGMLTANGSFPVRSSLTDAADSDPFFTPAQGKYRVIELWTLESLQTFKGFDPMTGRTHLYSQHKISKLKKINQKRPGKDRITYTRHHTVRWVCRWFNTNGDLLDRYFSPYPHCSHPFAVKFYPLTDGNVHPFIEDIIDQQKYINRLITLIDSVMQTSAKGVLLFPEDRKPDGITWEQIVQLWADHAGVIPYKSSSRTNDVPSQIHTKGATDDAHRILYTQLDLMNRISGVPPVLTGEAAATNSATLQSMLFENASQSLADILGSFDSLLSYRNHLVSTLISNS